MERMRTDISSEKVITFKDWLGEKWSKVITKCSNGKMVAELWKSIKLEI